MNIFADENIPTSTVRDLRQMGHDVRDLRGTSEQGMPDEALWKIAQQENRLLITTDKGFARYRNELHSGIMIVRLKQPNLRKIHERVMQAMNQYKAEQWAGRLVVMRDTLQSVFPPEE